jgi:hypothetical protein
MLDSKIGIVTPRLFTVTGSYCHKSVIYAVYFCNTYATLGGCMYDRRLNFREGSYLWLPKNDAIVVDRESFHIILDAAFVSGLLEET